MLWFSKNKAALKAGEISLLKGIKIG